MHHRLPVGRDGRGAGDDPVDRGAGPGRPSAGGGDGDRRAARPAGVFGSADRTMAGDAGRGSARAALRGGDAGGSGDGRQTMSATDLPSMSGTTAAGPAGAGIAELIERGP